MEKTTKRRKIMLLILLALALFAKGLYHQLKPLPPGMSRSWPERPLVEPRLLIDQTWQDAEGLSHLDHEIFDEIFRLIGQARKLVVVDMFLYNHSGGGASFPPLSRQLTDALVARKKAVPDIRMLVISDPFNTLYGGLRSPWFQRLRDAGIPVVETNLTALRDSNPLWSTPWRLCCQWLGNNPDGGWLPTHYDDIKVPLRSYLALPNFKANHRKALVVDHGDGLRGLVTSGNPHDGSSRHDNIALAFSGPAAADLLLSELAVAAMSDVHLQIPDSLRRFEASSEPGGGVSGRIVTEGEIRDAALAMIEQAKPGDSLDLAMFYLAHRGIIEALVRAHDRGVKVRVLLDANKDAFGREKSGIPNRSVAWDLHRKGIPVRWRNTHGEQFHTKALVRKSRDGHWQILLGSANFTRRNLDDYNLETDILVQGNGSSQIIDDFVSHFETVWNQGPGGPITLSLPYEEFKDESFVTYWRYRIMEATGISTF